MPKAIVYTSRKRHKGIAPHDDATGIAQYVAMHNVEVIDEFCAEGIAAISAPSAFSGALDSIQRSKADLLIVESLTDLANTVPVQEILIEAAHRSGAKLISIRDPKHENDNERAQIRAALEFLRQRERKMIGARLQAARVNARLGVGKAAGRKPYGFSKNPEEALYEREILSKITRLRQQGMSFGRIAEQLNQSEIKPRKGRRWWGKTVSVILQNSKQ